jgi:hypothetical protein
VYRCTGSQLLALETESDRSIKKLSVLLSSRLHLRAKRYALQNDQTLTDLIKTLLTDFLDAAGAPKEGPSK